MTERILITGVGGPAALGAMRSLQLRDLDFFAGDMDPNAAGLYTVPASRRILLLPANHPGYVDHVLDLCIAHRIDILWPTVDAELLPLAESRHRFERAGIKVLIHDLYTLRRCIDKWELYLACRGRIPCPLTRRYEEGKAEQYFHGACILKPRRGSGSRGIMRVEHARDCQKLGALDDYLVQDELPGEEYSVDVFISNDQQLRVAVPRIRSKVDSGIAVTSETVHDDEIQRFALEAAASVKLRGVANIQFKRGSDGVAHLLEINPRIGGTMVLTARAGVNVFSLALDNLKGDSLPVSLDFRELAVVRMHEERYVDPAELRAMRAQFPINWEVEPCAPVSVA